VAAIDAVYLTRRGGGAPPPRQAARGGSRPAPIADLPEESAAEPHQRIEQPASAAGGRS